MQSGADSPSEPSLDFLSPKFSAERALLESSSTRVQLPCPEVAPCDNLEQYASLSRGLCRNPPSTPAPPAPARLPVRRRETQRKPELVRGVRSVLSTMATPAPGPVSLVRRWRGDGVRVRVVVRHCAGVRGDCEGIILAFDQHLNLVLGEVSERFNPFRTVANGGVESQRKKKRKRREGDERSQGVGGGEQRRSLNKLFIRGDNVVLLSPALPPSQTIPHSVS